MKPAVYTENQDGRVWWCNSHNRFATHVCNERHCCRPGQSGILLPCFAIDVTDELEIEDGN